MTWTAEGREPDGRWRQLDSDTDVHQLIRRLKKWRADRGHLVDETRVRFEAGHPVGLMTAAPDLILTTTEQLTVDQVDQLRAEWAAD